MAFKQWSYDKMIQALLSGTVTQIELNPTEIENYLVLDARGADEFKVSHLIGAHHIDPLSESFNSNILTSEKPILVYCSVGLRSEKIGERIQQLNPDLKVYNLKGGIFQWNNDGKPIVAVNDSLTNRIHTYNKAWGIWVSAGEKVFP